MKDINDIGYHSLAALALYGLLRFALGSADGAAVLITALILYIREATQEQAKRYNYSVLNRSWLPTTWSEQKNLETWVPVIPIIVLAALV